MARIQRSGKLNSDMLHKSDDGYQQGTEKSPDQAAKTISLSLNFNNENQYHFTVEVPATVYTDETWDLTGVNSDGEEFDLCFLGDTLIRLLADFGHATKKYELIDEETLCKRWDIHAASRRGKMPVVNAEVKPAVKKAVLSHRHQLKH
jgi:hypothetical protein